MAESVNIFDLYNSVLLMGENYIIVPRVFHCGVRVQ